jgi:hypothetical protein
MDETPTPLLAPPAAKITQIKQLTPAAWAKAKAKEKLLAQAARDFSPQGELKRGSTFTACLSVRDRKSDTIYRQCPGTRCQP